MLKPAAAFGLLCFGPDEGRNVTFVAPADWLGTPVEGPSGDAAMRWALLRFFDAYGPATADDFRRWWGDQRAGPTNKLVKMHADDLVSVSVEGEPMWLASDAFDELAAVRAGGRRSPQVDLLPAFDPYVLAPQSHRRHTIPPGREAEVSRQAGWISQTLLVDGEVRGVWTHERVKDELQVEIRPFARLSAPVRCSAEQRAGEIADLLGCRAKVVVSAPHAAGTAR